MLTILNLYEKVYEMLALPVVKGKKTENEKFAGALYTTTVEGFIPGAGRGIQGATSHCLGQNFAKMFDIEFEKEDGKREKVWQNSWGLTTRTVRMHKRWLKHQVIDNCVFFSVQIGVMVMVHSDDKGLVLPPRVAPIQVVIVPIYMKGQQKDLNDKATELQDELKAAGIRVEVDRREIHNPGWKYADWEMRGVPLRLELGPKDLKAGRVTMVPRLSNIDKDKTNKTNLDTDKTEVDWKKLVTTVRVHKRAYVFCFCNIFWPFVFVTFSARLFVCSGG